MKTNKKDLQCSLNIISDTINNLEFFLIHEELDDAAVQRTLTRLIDNINGAQLDKYKIVTKEIKQSVTNGVS